MLMATKHQLRALLEDSCQRVEELTGDALKLVAEVQAIHYWTTHSLETFRQLHNIGRNLRTLIGEAEEVMGSQDELLKNPAGVKLAKTVYGLWRALPGLGNKITEQLSRRRRQRIMGIEPEDAGEIPQEQIEEEVAELRKLREQLSALYAELKILGGKIPEDLAVEFGVPGEQQEEEKAGGEPGEEPAVPVAEPKPNASEAPDPVEAATPEPEEPGVADPDEMSPV